LLSGGARRSDDDPEYFPKGTDFSAVTEAELDAVADELNDRPRKRLAFANPTEQLSELLLH
jgi:transposase, IS30 family